MYCVLVVLIPLTHETDLGVEKSLSVEGLDVAKVEKSLKDLVEGGKK